MAPPVAVKEPPKPAETPHASSAAKKKPKAAKPVIAPEPIDVEEDGDMNPRITPTVPPAETTPPADAPTTPAAEDQIWDAPPAAPAPAETPPAEAAPAETPPTQTAPPAEPAPATPAPAPAEPATTEPTATEPAPSN